MTVFGFAPLDAPVVAAYHLVLNLAALLPWMSGTAATAAAIVAFTLCVRLLLLPLAISQVRAEKARTALQPRVDTLRKRYRKDPLRLQQEITALYRSEGTSMFAGCLPALAQWPFFMVMYRLFVSATVGGEQNVLLVHTVLGQHLTGVLAVHGLFAAPSLLFLGLLGLLVVLAAWSSRRMAQSLPGLSDASGATGSAAAAGAAGAPAFAGTVLRLMPFGTVLVAAVVPFAAAIYLLTTTAWTAAERALLRRDLAPAA